jgi:hypothetical protein
MAIYDPRDIPGLVAWYSAEAETGYSDGQLMTQWLDLSGNGNHATATGLGTGRPKWQATTGPSGGPAIHFPANYTSNVTGYFDLPNMMSGASAGDVFVGIKAGAASGSYGLWSIGSEARDFYPNPSGQVVDGFGGRGSVTYTPTVAITSWRRLNATRHSDAKLTHRLDSLVQISTYPTSPTVGWHAAPFLGRQRLNPTTPDWCWMGHMSCFLIFNRELTSQERSDLDTWMIANPSGGLPVNPIGVMRWDGSAMQSVITRGWYENETLNPATLLGWWDGSSIRPLR